MFRSDGSPAALSYDVQSCPRHDSIPAPCLITLNLTVPLAVRVVIALHRAYRAQLPAEPFNGNEHFTNADHGLLIAVCSDLLRRLDFPDPALPYDLSASQRARLSAILSVHQEAMR